ncbi:hypothetical protein [Archaeoglobus neptunius]|uniref:hypothetical protein n=1 Tax=Archaeoglobus neptunius TaxID=2798580 RepID=UPI0019260F85|nr:hypothetical protein [Archaeoglobus neptunius]
MKYCTIAFILITIFTLGCLGPEEGSFTHTIDYTISLTFGELVEGRTIKPSSKVDELENITVIVPLPVIDGQPIKLQNLTIPAGWKAEITETPHGTMLKLEGKNVRTWKMSPMPVPVESGKTPTVTPTMVKKAAGYEFELRLQMNREINTLNPLNGEFVLQPKYELRRINCPEEYLKHYRYVKCYSYSTVVFYASHPSIDAGMYISLEGRNYWFQMGWTGNEFYDHILAFLTEDGWNNVTGSLETGKGVYLST